MNINFVRLAAMLAPCAMALGGCGPSGPPSGTGPNRLPASSEAPADQREGARADVHVNGAPNNDDLNVNVNPGGGVDVNVQGEPIRDRLRERRAIREAETEEAGANP